MSDQYNRVLQSHRLFKAGRAAEARALLQRGLQQSPDDVELNAAMALQLRQLNQHPQAVYFAQRAVKGIRQFPAQADVLLSLGELFGLAGQPERAIEAFAKAVEAAPREEAPRYALGGALYFERRFDEAERVCREGLEVMPASASIAAALYASVLAQGRAREAVEVLRRAIPHNPGDPRLVSGLAVSLAFVAGVPAEEIFEAHLAYGRLMERYYPGPYPGFSATDDPERALRVGILSSDLRNHAVASFVLPLVQHLDKRSFHVTCYAVGHVVDEVSARFKACCSVWKHVASLLDPELTAAIRADRIDILLELNGHTHGYRMPVMEARPAPVQATYVGYPNTTGMRSIGWRIVDSLTDPAPGADALAVERLARIDPCFLCYLPLEEAPAPEPTPPSQRGGRGGAFTFGSFNALQKIDDPVVLLWARLLGAVPGSRLLLKNNGLSQEATRAALLVRFERAGADVKRLELVPFSESFGGHLATYARVDLALDTFPYCGTTTTCEAMYMGVPTVTLVGRTHVERVGLSLLSAAGLGELAAASEEEYLLLAASLAGDPERLTRLRSGLRERMLGSALCDGPAFGRRFGEALREMWRARAGGRGAAAG